MEEMVRQLDLPKADKAGVKLVQLEHAGASEVLQALRPFYGRQATSAADPEDRNVAITADDRIFVADSVNRRIQEFKYLPARQGREES